MKVLMSSLDASLLDAQPAGDVLQRMKDYAQRVDELDVLVFSPRSESKVVNDHLRIVGSGGSIKPTQLFLGWRKAVELARDKDVITAQDPFFTGLAGWLASYRAGIPLVIDVHGDFFGGQIGFLKLALARFLLRRAKLIRVVNPKIKKDLEQISIQADKIYCQPVPVDVSSFEHNDFGKANDIRRKFGGAPLLLYVGRLSAEKGLDTLIEALVKLGGPFPDAKLLILGDGPEKGNIDNLLKNKNLQKNVFLIGQVGTDEIKYYYHACDIFVLPSRQESFGRVILEAAMAGKPVITTLTAGATYHIRDRENGYLVPVNNSPSLAQTITDVWSVYDTEARKAGERLHQEVKLNYNYQTDIGRLIKLWKLVTKEK